MADIVNASNHQKVNKPIFEKIKKIFRSNISGWLILLPSLLLLYFLVWRPVVIGTAFSFFEMKGYTPVKFVGLENYKLVLSDSQFLKTLSNTIQYVIWSLVIGYLPPIIIAIMLNEIIHLRGWFKFSIYFPAIVPAIVTSLIWYLIYYPDTSGLLNGIISIFGAEPSRWLQNGNNTILLIVISMTWNTMGATTIMYLASLSGINHDLYEAAVLDGAGFFKRVINITIPQISGVMLLLFVRQIISVFQIMVEPLAMTGGGPNNASVSLALQGYRYGFVYFKVDYAMALGVVTFLILTILTAFYFKINKKISN